MTKIAVEVATASATYAGQGAGPDQRVRLVDLLGLVSVLTISDCSVRPLGRQGEATISGATCHLPVRRIVWGRPTDDSADDRPVTDHDRVEKVAHAVLVLASNFLIRGNVHFAPEADPMLAFERLAQGFFPVSTATVSCLADESNVWEMPIVVVNGAMVEAFGLEPKATDTAQAAAAAA